MSIKKITIAGLAGGVAAFLLGWLVYGIILKDMIAEHSNTSFMRAETDMIWWALIVSNLAWGFLLAYIYNRWANITSPGAGFSAGAIICLLIGLSYSLSMYSMSTLYTDSTGLIMDIVTGTIMGGIIGAIVGFVLGKVKG
jgi:hypothetical protein